MTNQPLRPNNFRDYILYGDERDGMLPPSWYEEVPKVAKGNTFASEDLFYCKAGMFLALRTEEQYRRAQEVVRRYPFNHRILRYEEHGFLPTLYVVYNDVDATTYVATGEGSIPLSPHMKRGEEKE